MSDEKYSEDRKLRAEIAKLELEVRNEGCYKPLQIFVPFLAVFVTVLLALWNMDSNQAKSMLTQSSAQLARVQEIYAQERAKDFHQQISSLETELEAKGKELQRKNEEVAKVNDDLAESEQSLNETRTRLGLFADQVAKQPVSPEIKSEATKLKDLAQWYQLDIRIFYSEHNVAEFQETVRIIGQVLPGARITPERESEGIIWPDEVTLSYQSSELAEAAEELSVALNAELEFVPSYLTDSAIGSMSAPPPRNPEFIILLPPIGVVNNQ